jgi:hypothetical protein
VWLAKDVVDPQRIRGGNKTSERRLPKFRACSIMAMVGSIVDDVAFVGKTVRHQTLKGIFWNESEAMLSCHVAFRD